MHHGYTDTTDDTNSLLYQNLSYAIIGVLFDVYNELGYGYQEKYYYRAVKNKLAEKGLVIKEQLLTPLTIGGKSIGRYYLDFLINGKVVLELKVANQIYPKHIKQVLGYLKANHLRVGIIGAFTKDGVLLKRVIN
jgi:GxxExxY protein